MMEEAEINLHQAQELCFAGLVTWTFLNDHTLSSRGMYAFLARFAPDFPIWSDRPTSEGLLSWKALDWVCDLSNSSVVSNIPHFLPRMLTDPKPQEYYCSYREGTLQAVVTCALPVDLRDR